MHWSQQHKATGLGLYLGLLFAGFSVHPLVFGQNDAARGAVDFSVLANRNASAPLRRSKPVNFKHESASPDTRHTAEWVVDSRDNRNLPFVIVDKTDGKVFIFHADGRLRGAAPALMGLAVGDDSVPGIGDRTLSSILPQERTTPAGRFVAALDHNLQGKEILWVDYETAISLHPVITSNPMERRAERLATPSPLDNRITYGCINVPVQFFKQVVVPAFKTSNGIVYVLPETMRLQAAFPSLYIL